jgi:hypothetical protein
MSYLACIKNTKTALRGSNKAAFVNFISLNWDTLLVRPGDLRPTVDQFETDVFHLFTNPKVRKKPSKTNLWTT